MNFSKGGSDRGGYKAIPKQIEQVAIASHILN
jgi:hypothetical protein